MNIARHTHPDQATRPSASREKQVIKLKSNHKHSQSSTYNRKNGFKLSHMMLNQRKVRLKRKRTFTSWRWWKVWPHAMGKSWALWWRMVDVFGWGRMKERRENGENENCFVRACELRAFLAYLTWMGEWVNGLKGGVGPRPNCVPLGWRSNPFFLRARAFLRIRTRMYFI